MSAKKVEKKGKKKVEKRPAKKARLPRKWEPFAVAGGVLALLAVNALLGWTGTGWSLRLASLLGIPFLLGIALLMSADRRKIPLRTVLVGLGLQLALGLIVLRTPVGGPVFETVGLAFDKIMESSKEGAAFVFGILSTDAPSAVLGGTPKEPGDPIGFVKIGLIMAFQALPVIIFMGALSRMLYHLGVLQWVVRGLAWLMRRLMRATGAESLSAGANVFVGMVEAPLMIRPYVAGLTRSELFCIMSVGMATVAGSVMAVYISMIKGFLPNAAGHLLTASLMSAPAAILIAKIMIPETGEPATLDADVMPKIDEGGDKPVNVMDAAARGALEGLKLALNVAGMLIAFIALVAMANAILGALSGGHLTFQRLAGWLFSPLAVGMGIPWGEAARAGTLIGEKTVLNDWIAYDHFAKMMAEPATALGGHTKLVMSYALCGFANFGSVAIMIAGLGGIAPNQRPNLARLGLLSIVSGSLAAFMTGCWAGLLG